jgi:hypothetical protein
MKLGAMDFVHLKLNLFDDDFTVAEELAAAHRRSVASRESESLRQSEYIVNQRRASSS